MIGICKFCGQTKEVPFAADAETASDAATLECACPGAKNAKEIAEKIEIAQGKVYELFGTGCEDYGLIPVDNPAVIETLCALVEEVGQGYISSASMDIYGIGKASVKLTSKGRIAVERKVTKAFKLEG